MALTLAAGAAPATTTAPAADLREAEASFVGSGGAHLAGTLAGPADAAGGRRLPALVLVAGSGPTDRDDNQPPAIMDDLFKTLADRLARRGVVTLRYDKRGMFANRAEMPRGEAALGEFFAWDPFVGDAAAAVRWLRDRPDVDPARVGILGHSEGGLLALCAAADLSRDGGRPPAALVLLAAPGRPIDAVVADQLSALLVRQHATPRQAQAVTDANDQVRRSLREAGHLPAGGVPPGLAALYPPYLSKFWHQQMAADPATLAAAYGGPVLVVNGTGDTQVSADRDAKAFDAALGRRPHDRHRLVLVDGANHFLKPPPAAAEAPFGSGDVAPATLDAIVAWAVNSL